LARNPNASLRGRLKRYIGREVWVASGPERGRAGRLVGYVGHLSAVVRDGTGDFNVSYYHLELVKARRPARPAGFRAEYSLGVYASFPDPDDPLVAVTVLPVRKDGEDDRRKRGAIRIYLREQFIREQETVEEATTALSRQVEMQVWPPRAQRAALEVLLIARDQLLELAPAQRCADCGAGKEVWKRYDPSSQTGKHLWLCGSCFACRLERFRLERGGV
jgi:hypothetical protein